MAHLNAVRLKRMVDISRTLNSTTNIDVLLTEIIREAADLTGCEAASILLFDQRTRKLHFKASSNPMTVAMLETPVPLDNSIAGTILQQNKPMIAENAREDERWNPEVDQVISFHTTSILGVPMRNNEEPIGVLEALNKQDGRFTEEDLETMQILADMAGVALAKAHLIDELRSAYDELNELDQLKSDFIAIASHELRTPLSIILGYVSFLREEANPEMASQLDNVLKAAIRLRGLIQDMLNFQYADLADKPEEVEKITLSSLVKGAIKKSTEAAHLKQLSLASNLPHHSIHITADRSMIEAVLDNLLDNAIKFTPGGGQINISVEQVEQEVWLRVSDNGIGIPKDKLERIFKRFYQVENHMQRRYGGMGMGLATAKQLVELHGGRMWAENRKPRGSTFFIVLPLHPLPNASDE